MLHKNKAQSGSHQSPSSTPASKFKPVNNIPAFFLIRVVAWFVMAGLITAISIVICLVAGKLDATLALGILLAALFAYKGADLLYTACKNKYFILNLKCVDITQRSLKDVRNVWDPISQTAFRKTSIISFIDDHGTRFSFLFDANRRFVMGSCYTFYFRRPNNPGEVITAELLEQLKIDHEVVEVPIDVGTLQDEK